MIAAVPQWLIDLGVGSTAFAAFAGATVILWRTPPVRLMRRGCGWVFELFIGTPFRTIAAKLGDWFRAQVQEANAEDSEALADLSRRFEEHRHYVGYHLGPNGTTKPVHERLCTVERAVAGSTPVAPFVDWNSPYEDEEDA